MVQKANSPYIRAYDSYDVAAVSDEAGLACKDESKAVQSQEAEANINTIVRNFGITGKMPENPRLPMYGDFSEITDYRSALEAVRSADASFMELPADVRAKFENDPQRLLEAVSVPGNEAMLRDLGLISSSVPAGEPAPAPAPAPAPPA